MKIIYNSIIPLRPFYAINIFGVVFARKDGGRMSVIVANHEMIHTLQQREMLFIPFYIWYVAEWLLLMLKYRNIHKAYRHISFEREAYRMEHDLNYRYHRKHFAWLRKG